MAKSKEQIEEIIAGLSPEEVAQKTEEYKQKLTAENVPFHHKAGLATLIMTWQEHDKAEPKNESRASRALRMRKEATKLIRVRITNHNPANKNKQGELFVTGNDIIGEIRSFVPYNCEAAQQYHLPQMVLDVLREKKFRAFRSRTNSEGHKIVTPYEEKEYSFELLKPLTQAELDKLKRRQSIANGTLPEEEL